jgi:hypothetical protein
LKIFQVHIIEFCALCEEYLFATLSLF